MLLKKKHVVVFIFLFILALFIAHSSTPQSTANAQNENNPQIHDVPFNLSSAQLIESPDVQTIRIPDPSRLEEYVLHESSEQSMIVDGTLDKFIFLPMINNNYVNFFDDFSNPNSGFPILDTSTNTYQYINGEYQILNKTSSYLGAVSLGYKLEEFKFEVSMRRVGSAKGFYGLVYWLDDTWSNYYLFMISPDTAEIFQLKYTTSAGFTLVSVTSPNSSVNLGNAINRVGIRQYREWDGSYPEGLTTRFVINGSTEGSPSYPIPEGAFRVGFFAAPIDANHQVHFDDFMFENYCFGAPGCSN